MIGSPSLARMFLPPRYTAKCWGPQGNGIRRCRIPIPSGWTLFVLPEIFVQPEQFSGTGHHRGQVEDILHVAVERLHRTVFRRHGVLGMDAVEPEQGVLQRRLLACLVPLDVVPAQLQVAGMAAPRSKPGGDGLPRATRPDRRSSR